MDEQPTGKTYVGSDELYAVHVWNFLTASR